MTYLVFQFTETPTVWKRSVQKAILKTGECFFKLEVLQNFKHSWQIARK